MQMSLFDWNNTKLETSAQEHLSLALDFIDELEQENKRLIKKIRRKNGKAND